MGQNDLRGGGGKTQLHEAAAPTPPHTYTQRCTHRAPGRAPLAPCVEPLELLLGVREVVGLQHRVALSDPVVLP
jgi:hypothetical protein